MINEINYSDFVDFFINGDWHRGYLKHFDSNGYVYQINVDGSSLIIPARDAEEMKLHKWQFNTELNNHNLNQKLQKID